MDPFISSYLCQLHIHDEKEPLFDVDAAFTRLEEAGVTVLQDTGLESVHRRFVGSPEAHVSNDDPS